MIRYATASPLKAAAEHILRDTDDTPEVAIGPAVWNVQTGHDQKHWYFIVCSLSADRNLRIDQLKVVDEDTKTIQNLRAGLIMELVSQKSGVFIDFDDELELARWCEVVAPGERSRSIRTAIERERT